MSLYDELLSDYMTKQASHEDPRDLLEGLSTEELEALAAEIGAYSGNPADVAAMAEVMPVYKEAAGHSQVTTTADREIDAKPASVLGTGESYIDPNDGVPITASQALFEILKEGAAMEDVIEARAQERVLELLKEAGVDWTDPSYGQAAEAAGGAGMGAGAAEAAGAAGAQAGPELFQAADGSVWQKVTDFMSNNVLRPTAQFINENPKSSMGIAGAVGAGLGYGAMNMMQNRDVQAFELLEYLNKVANESKMEESFDAGEKDVNDRTWKDDAKDLKEKYKYKAERAADQVKYKAQAAKEGAKNVGTKALEHVKSHKVGYGIGAGAAAAAAGAGAYAYHKAHQPEEKAAAEIVDDIVKEALYEDFIVRLAELDGVEFLKEALYQAELEKEAAWNMEKAKELIFKAYTGASDFIAGAYRGTKENLQKANVAWEDFRTTAAKEGMAAAIAKYPMASTAFAGAGGTALGAGIAGVSGYVSTAPSPNTTGGTSAGPVPNSNVNTNIDFEHQLVGSKQASEYEDLKEFIKAALLG